MATSESQDKVLLQPYNYLLQCPGKQIRTKLIQAFNHWLRIPEEKLRLISEVVEMLHNASLLIDDIEDNSVLRRGYPVAHNIFGIASTINSANYVYFLALQKINREFPLESFPKAVNIFTEQLLELHRGQGMDIHWRDSFRCPSETEYLDMIKRKTGGLFGLGVGLMHLFSPEKERYDFSSLIASMGIYFQVRDDYANLNSSEYAANKSYCEDLSEGKFSFPIVHAIQTYPDDPTIINIIRQRPKEVEIKKFTVNYLEKLGSFQYTKDFLRTYEQRVKSECEKLGGNPYLSRFLEELKI